MDLAPLLDAEGKGRIRKGKGKGGYRKEGEEYWLQKGGLSLPSLKCGCHQASLAGYIFAVVRWRRRARS